MNSSAFPLLASASITFISMLVGALAYSSLKHESVGQSISLGAFTSTPRHYNLADPTTPHRCFGSFTIGVTPISTQTTLSAQGWVLVALNDRVEPVSFDATMIFNALGQLSASLLRTTFGNDSLRFGTLGVNPLSLQLYRGEGSNQPLLQHSVPGPVELSIRDGVYELHLPSLPALGATRLPVDSRFLSALSVVPAEQNVSCQIATAGHIDLTPLTRLADSLQRAIPGALSGL